MARAQIVAAASDSLAVLVARGLRVVPDSDWARVLHPPASPWSWERVLTIFGLIVVPLAAALLGAVIGGRQTRKAALESFQLHQEAESTRARTKLVHYLRRSLEGTQVIALALASVRSTRDAPWRDPARQLLDIWNEYDGLAIDLHLLGPYDFGLKYHTFVMGLRLVVRSALEMEAEFDAMSVVTLFDGDWITHFEGPREPLALRSL